MKKSTSHRRRPRHGILIGLWRVLSGLVLISLFLILVVSNLKLLVKPIENLINSSLPHNIAVSGLSFSRIEPSGMTWSIHDITFTLTHASESWTGSADHILLADAGCLASRTPCQLFIENARLEGGETRLIGAHGNAVFSFHADTLSANGFIAADSIHYKEYAVTNASLYFEKRGSLIMFNRASAQAYQGRIRLEGCLPLTPDEDINVTLNFKNVNTDLMSGLNRQWKGILDGTASYTGTLKTIRSLALDFRSSSSQIEKTLLKYMMGDIGGTLAFLPFAQILENADFIHLDHFQGTVHNLGQESLAIKLKIESSELNLNLNPNITIHLR